MQLFAVDMKSRAGAMRGFALRAEGNITGGLTLDVTDGCRKLSLSGWLKHWAQIQKAKRQRDEGRGMRDEGKKLAFPVAPARQPPPSRSSPMTYRRASLRM